MKKKRFNKVLNLIIVLLLVISIGLGFFSIMQPSQKTKHMQNDSVKSERRSNSKKHKSSHSSKKETSKNKEDDTNNRYNSSSTQESSQQNSNDTSDNVQHAGGVVVINGPNFNYRAAQTLGLIPNVDTETSVTDFYSNCRDFEGGFVYNGNFYKTEVIQDGHENEYHCHILVTPAN